jgi:hypothetical protein
MSFRRVDTNSVPKTAANFPNGHAEGVPYTGTMMPNAYAYGQFAAPIPHTATSFANYHMHGQVPNTSVHWRGLLPYYWAEGITDEQYAQYKSGSNQYQRYTPSDAWNTVKNGNYYGLAGDVATLAGSYVLANYAQEYAAKWLPEDPPQRR